MLGTTPSWHAGPRLARTWAEPQGLSHDGGRAPPQGRGRLQEPPLAPPPVPRRLLMLRRARRPPAPREGLVPTRAP